jgi:hypothetical protein
MKEHVRVHDILMLQSFEGTWDLTQRLRGVLAIPSGVSDDAITSKLEGLHKDACGTLLAIWVLKRRYAGDVSAWRMLVEKAVSWLKATYKVGVADIARLDWGIASMKMFVDESEGKNLHPMRLQE